MFDIRADLEPAIVNIGAKSSYQDAARHTSKYEYSLFVYSVGWLFVLQCKKNTNGTIPQTDMLCFPHGSNHPSWLLRIVAFSFVPARVEFFIIIKPLKLIKTT